MEKVETKKEEKSLAIPDKRLPSLEELLKAGVHFGHHKGRWEPKAKKNIYGERHGVHVIDLQKTSIGLEKALDRIQKIVKNNKSILFLGTKKQAVKMILDAAQEVGMPYVTERWLGGTLTNFKTIAKRISKLKAIEDKEKTGELKKYTKKEQLKFKKQIEDFNKKMGGIKDMKKLPAALVVIGAKEEKTALKEARITGVDIIALADTNIDPAIIDYPIPANDDAVSSIRLILAHIVREIVEAKK